MAAEWMTVSQHVSVEPAHPDDLVEVRVWLKDGVTFRTQVCWANRLDGVDNKTALRAALFAARSAIVQAMEELDGR